VSEQAQSQWWWTAEGFFLVQQFDLGQPALSPKQLIVAIDRQVMARNRRLTLNLASWREDTLWLGPIALLRLGPLMAQPPDRVGGGWRAIRGGLIAQSAPGSLYYTLAAQQGRTLLSVGLAGFVPRLPRVLFEHLQLPVHRRLIRAAAGDLQAELARAAPDNRA